MTALVLHTPTTKTT